MNILKKHNFFVFFCICIIYFFISCGFDVFYYLEPPIRLVEPSNTNPVTRLFSFQVNSSGNSGSLDDVFQGTVVFYRLYNASSPNSIPAALTSDIASIASQNGQYSTSAANALQRLHYQMLAVPLGQVPLIPKSSGNANVDIRLYSESTYPAAILVNGSSLGVPQRITGGAFNFFDANAPSALPQYTDTDVQFSQGLGFDVWYVNAYALSSGMDINFSPLYSSAVHLGYIIISK